jgi:UDP-N-acetylglucosamine:LPS N-acetylglucosamine transferase
VEELLASGKLREMSRSALKLGKPGAARAVCDEVMRRVGVSG